jgi:hypothetical protein
VKTKKKVGIIVLLAAAMATVYWIRHQHDKSSGGTVSSLRQVGLSYRYGRNDLAAPFQTTEAVPSPTENQTQKR